MVELSSAVAGSAFSPTPELLASFESLFAGCVSAAFGIAMRLTRNQADAEDLSTSAQDLGVEFTNVTWEESDVTGGKKLSIKSMTVTADGQTVTIERDAANGSLTVTLPDQPAVTLDEDTIDTYLADAMGSADLDQQALDIIKREFKQVIGLGLVTVQVDGKWYVSPIRSVSDIFVSLLKGLEPGDVDYLINLAKN